MKITTVPVNNAKSISGKNKEDHVDYSSLPKITEAQLYNIMVFGTKNAPKPK